MLSYLFTLAFIFTSPNLELDLPVNFVTGKVELKDPREIVKDEDTPIAVSRLFKGEECGFSLFSQVYAYVYTEEGVGDVFEVELPVYGKVKFIKNSSFTYSPYFGVDFCRGESALSGIDHPDNLHVTEAGRFIIITYLDGRKLVFEKELKRCKCGFFHLELIKEYDIYGNCYLYSYDEDKLLSKVEAKDQEGVIISQINMRREWSKKRYTLFVHGGDVGRKYTFKKVDGKYRFTGLMERQTQLEEVRYDDLTGNLSYWKDKSKGSFTFGYVGRDKVASVTKYGYGSKTKYFIKYRQNKTTVSSETKLLYVCHFDDEGRVTAVERGPYKEIRKYGADGKVSERSFYYRNNLIGKKEFSYDVFHNVKSITSEVDGVASCTEFKYDKKCRLIQECTDRNLLKEYSYLGEGGLLEKVTQKLDGKDLFYKQYFYDKKNRLIKVVDTDNEIYYKILYHSYINKDFQSRKPISIQKGYKDLQSGIEIKLGGIGYQYQKGRLHERRITDSKEKVLGVESYTYRNDGKRTKKCDFFGFETLYSYDAFGRVARIKKGGRDISLTYSEGDKATEISYSGEAEIERYSYDAEGTLLKKEGAFGIKEYQYDQLGRSILDGREVVTLDVLGRPVYKKRGKILTAYQYKGEFTPSLVKYFDKTFWSHKQIEEGVFLNRNRKGVEGRSVYDLLGNEIERVWGNKRFSYLYKGDLLLEEKGPEGYFKRYFYDGNKRLVRIEGAEDKTFSYDDFSRVTHLTSSGVTKEYQYDLYNRIIVEEVAGKSLYHFYDEYGNQTTRKGKDSAFPVNVFDVYGRKTEVKRSESKTIFSYDKGFCEKSSFCKRRKEYYNSFGELTEERDFSANGELYRTCSYITDSNGTPVCRKAKTVEGEKVLSFKYDASGEHLLEERLCENGKEWITSFVYDKYYNLVEKKFPDGVSIYFRYDRYGRKRKVFSSDSTIDYELYYDLLDRIAYVKDYTHGIVCFRSYDMSGNLILEKFTDKISIEYSYFKGRRVKCILPDKSIVMYRYNARGSLSFVDKLGVSGNYLYSHQYLYDGRGKVCREIHPYHLFSSDIDYDKDGSPCSIHNPFYSQKLQKEKGRISSIEEKESNQSIYYNDQNEIIEKGDNPLVEYDERGRVIFDGKRVFSYDALDRIVSVTEASSGKKVLYVYDYFGRLRKTIGKVTRDYIYDGDLRIGSSVRGSFDEVAVVNPYSRKVIAVEIKGKEFLAVNDLLNNTVLMVDPVKSLVVKQCVFSPFGASDGSSSSMLRYRGRHRMESAPVYQFGERFYHTELKMFLSRDPMWQDFGLSSYRFCKNNPLGYKDEDGLFSTRWDRAISKRVKERIDEAFTFPGQREKSYYMVNGLYTSKEYQESCTSYMEEFLSQPITPYYRPCKDSFFGVLAEYFGSNKKARGLFELIRQDLQGEVKEVVLFGHSAGGATISRALKMLNRQERAKVRVALFGSASMVDPSYVKSASNYYSSRDYLMNALHWIVSPRAIWTDKISIPSKTKGGIMDHSLMDKTYREGWEGELSFSKVY